MMLKLSVVVKELILLQNLKKIQLPFKFTVTIYNIGISKLSTSFIVVTLSTDSIATVFVCVDTQTIILNCKCSSTICK